MTLEHHGEKARWHVQVVNIMFSFLQQEKPRLLEPLDYEAVIEELEKTYQNDPLQDLLFFPKDDFSVSSLKLCKFRRAPQTESMDSLSSTLLLWPSDITLLQQESRKYPLASSIWKSGDSVRLAEYKPEKLPSHSFEVDHEDADKDEVSERLKVKCLKRKGHEFCRMLESSNSGQSFKKRYFQLTQLPDNSYIMNFYKDEKISKEPKGCIFLDSCTGVVQVSRNPFSPGLFFFMAKCIQQISATSLQRKAGPVGWSKMNFVHISFKGFSYISLDLCSCSSRTFFQFPFLEITLRRSVFKDNQGNVDRDSRFSPLYRQESSKISTEDLLKLVSDYRRKMQTIPGSLDIAVDAIPLEHPNCVTSSFIPVKPFNMMAQPEPTVEVEEFIYDSTKYCRPYRVYKNQMYIYPRHLKYDSQKCFNKARNITVCIEFKNSDEEGAKPVKCIYGKPGGPLFTSAAHTAVLHHSQSPDFSDEVKIELPTQLHDKHHILFSFYHITCDINAKASAKKKEALETSVGYAWLPLMKQDQIASQEYNIPIATSLPPNYLSIEDSSSGKVFSNIDIKWVDGGKPLFKVSTFVVSTVNTQVSAFFSDTQSDKETPIFPESYQNELDTLVMVLCDHVIWKYKDALEETKRANHSAARFLKRCFTFMDRGFVFKMVNNYISMFSSGDLKTLCQYKFDFLQEVCQHEHFIPLCLPIRSANIPGNISQNMPEYSVTNEFCRKHFLIGILLREVGFALQEDQDIRHLALAVLKNLMAKHSFDDRYREPKKQAQIASLYMPLYGMLLDNMPRIYLKDLYPFTVNTSNQVTVPHWLFNSQIPRPLSLIGSTLRFDKLDQAETRSLLMCFLHIMKTISDGKENFKLNLKKKERKLCISKSLMLWNPSVLSRILNNTYADFQRQLQQSDCQNSLMKRVFDTYMLFFQVNQSATALKHVFASLRLFVCKFPSAFFQGPADLCGSFCYEVLKCCNHRSRSTQTEASALLYFFMRKNFEFNKQKSIVRSHLQLIKAVSQLIADAGIGGSRFQHSLAITNNFANGDKQMKNSNFPAEVKDLTKRIRTVLMATAQMKEHEKDPEMLVDLQYSLANSYASTPELRRTWLESMAKIHARNGDLSEAAMCYIHIAALIAEYLKRKGMFSMGWPAFLSITPNIKEEGAMKEDSGMQDIPYNENILVEQLYMCVEFLWKSERYELIADVNKPIIAVFEKQRDFKKLSDLYYDIHRSYLKVAEVVNSEKRLFGRYYRVAFYGQGFFEEEEGKEYIYKEPKLTGLSEISQRLLKLYADKFGADNVKIIQDSNKVNPKDLDPKYAYIQVTYVTPFFEEKEIDDRKTDFEMHHNISRFVFETPFTLSGKKHGGVAEQCKRRTILTTSHLFPYVKKRIQVVSQSSTDLNPIEVAIDEMSKKVSELNQLCTMDEVDMIRLQLKLQGSVSVKVNAGPMAYARAFLEETNAKKYPDNQVKLLKEIFRQFADACGQALDVNEHLIKEDQLEYQEELRSHYKDMLSELSAIMNEQVSEVELEKNNMRTQILSKIFRGIYTGHMDCWFSRICGSD
uniref:Dedicator of cytokinesis 10 n=1 Tax=Castor canadensis TaxID=51338 RepID=A0A8C0XUA8_CASCN